MARPGMPRWVAQLATGPMIELSVKGSASALALGRDDNSFGWHTGHEWAPWIGVKMGAFGPYLHAPPVHP